MADILIKGIELPRTLTIYPNGDIDELIDGKYVTIGKAIKLPEHGDLISKKALEVQIAHAFHGNMFPDISAGLALNKVMNIITDAPTIVEASNE